MNPYELQNEVLKSGIESLKDNGVLTLKTLPGVNFCTLNSDFIELSETVCRRFNKYKELEDINRELLQILLPVTNILDAIPGHILAEWVKNDKESLVSKSREVMNKAQSFNL